jgi:hypothetical protein
MTASADWVPGTHIRMTPTPLCRWARIVALQDGPGGLHIWARWNDADDDDPHADFIIHDTRGWTTAQPEPPKPEHVHRMQVSYDVNDDGIWLGCSCTWRMNMGQTPDPWDIEEAASNHMASPG